MKLLLDSHLLLWWAMESPRLGRKTQDLILDNHSELFMSAASWWELGLKCALGKLEADLAELRHVLEARGVAAVAVTFQHSEAAARLPILHRDPFDHMLVAQAVTEGHKLLTRDKMLRRYGDAVLCV